MQLDFDVKMAIEKINFIERYRGLSSKYSFKLNESFEHYDNNNVLAVFNRLGYKAIFNKKENFYKVVDELSWGKMQFNISLKYGVVELIWSIWKGENLCAGGTWSMLKVQYDGVDDDKIRKPVFRNYIDLEEILAEAFAIYEDFKREFLSNQ